jgi:DNA-binding GntR family transcriptional regulator
MTETELSLVLASSTDDRFKLERNSLKAQTVDVLRDWIINGKLPPGTRLVEREVAQVLGVSRAPIRDALMELEKEGLVENGPNGRCVIELSERDIRELYEVRLSLERLAVKLAAENVAPENRAALSAKLKELRDAVKTRDRSRYIKSDLESHFLVWRQAGNRHLLKMLDSMVGPIFMFIANNAEIYDWNATLGCHEEMVDSISTGDADRAIQSMDHHIREALERSLKVFQAPERES